jgi:drug/metabolite transporter (DMT)-like permease
MMAGNILALTSAILYGIADFLGGIATRRWAVVPAACAAQAFGLLALAAVIPLVPGKPMNTHQLAWSVGAGMTAGGGIPLLYAGLALGPVSVVAPITAVCSIVVPVVAGLLAGEQPPAVAWVGIGLAGLAVALISRGHGAGGAGPTARALAIALGAGLGIGMFLVCLARGGRDTGLQPLLVARATATLALAFVTVLSRVPRASPKEARWAAVGCGILDAWANTLYLVAVRQGSLGLVATLASLYPASTVLLGRLVLSERIAPVQAAGLGCAAVAAVLITGATP